MVVEVSQENQVSEADAEASVNQASPKSKELSKPGNQQDGSQRSQSGGTKTNIVDIDSFKAGGEPSKDDLKKIDDDAANPRASVTNNGKSMII